MPGPSTSEPKEACPNDRDSVSTRITSPTRGRPNSAHVTSLLARAKSHEVGSKVHEDNIMSGKNETVTH